MSTLRARTIRLANENPDLQPLLLPILAEDAHARVAADTKGKKSVSGTAIRSGYYESGDHIGALESAVKADPATSGDAKLIKAVEDLQKAHSAVFAALKPYNWD